MQVFFLKESGCKNACWMKKRRGSAGAGGVKKFMRKLMAVYDEDPVYAQRLADYVNQKEKLPFGAMAFSSLERLKEYLAEHPAEILLVGEGSAGMVENLGVKQVMILREGEVVEEKEAGSSIYKYQSGSGIMREVMAAYCCTQPEPSLSLLAKRAVVMGVYSPIGRCGKSALALTMAQVLGRNFSVLYMNLEEYSGFSRLVDEGFQRDLSDVLYLYRQGTFNWLKLKTMIYQWGGIDYIGPARYGEDLDLVPPEEMGGLIGRIAGESGYERLVVDLGRCGRGSMALLDACDVIYMPVREDWASQAKLEEFEEYVSLADDSRVREKIQKLSLPQIRLAGRRENYGDQLLWGELGDFVRRLLGGGQSEK